ncbi:hypothetical protein SNE40_020653 [Patella caerulea]|uniref:Uncharacterized protein n=1 Tax=Patella caerulea TaxID=87958 RepID=A0AAN8PG23_PATCE
MAGIKHRLSSIWGEFLNETTLHGCKNTFNKQHGPLKRTLWFLCVIIMGGILVYTTCTFCMKYLDFDFVTRTSVIYNPELEFPAITLCNLDPLDKNKFNISAMDDIHKADPLVADYVEQFLRGSLNVSDSKWLDLRPNETELNKLGFGIHDIIRYAYLIDPKPSPVESEFSITYRKPLEKCFTFNGRYMNKTYDRKPLKFEADSILFLHLDTNKDRYAFYSQAVGFRLVLHHPDEPIHFRSPSSVFSPGYMYEITISEKRYKYLPTPYNSYQNQDCRQVEKSNQGSGEYRSPYSRAGCILECRTNRTQSLCGCIIESLLHDNSSVLCDISQRHFCAMSSATSREFCDCKRPCLETKYDYELSSFPLTPNRQTPSEFVVTISFKDMMVTTVEHEPELDFGDIISHLGGYMGFYLGASVLTLFELVEVVLKSLKAIGLHRHCTVNSTQIPPANPCENHTTDCN